MGTNTFANTNEICSKGSSGKAVVPPMDVCFTPPPTPAGTEPPVPYPNTAMASDLDKGSAKVLICNKMAALEKDSFMKTSIGNEAAKPSTMQGGILSKTTKGKAYFAVWSGDVKFEGKGVCRHCDMTTHNHSSDPSNGAQVFFASIQDVPTACKKINDKIESKEGCNAKTTSENNGKVENKVPLSQCDGLMSMPKSKKASEIVATASKNDTEGLDKYMIVRVGQSKRAYEDLKPSASAKASAIMSKRAQDNKCLKVARCILTPKKESEKTPGSSGKQEVSCCPGQSGHHVVPEAMAKDLPCWPQYDDAPCICVEGTTHSNGTHGLIHQNLLRRIGAKGSGKQINCEDLVREAAGSVLDTFSNCNEGCILAQLKSNKNGDCSSCTKGKNMDVNPGTGSRKEPGVTYEAFKTQK